MSALACRSFFRHVRSPSSTACIRIRVRIRVRVVVTVTVTVMVTVTVKVLPASELNLSSGSPFA